MYWGAIAHLCPLVWRTLPPHARWCLWCVVFASQLIFFHQHGSLIVVPGRLLCCTCSGVAYVGLPHLLLAVSIAASVLKISWVHWAGAPAGFSRAGLRACRVCRRTSQMGTRPSMAYIHIPAKERPAKALPEQHRSQREAGRTRSCLWLVSHPALSSVAHLVHPCHRATRLWLHTYSEPSWRE